MWKLYNLYYILQFTKTFYKFFTVVLHKVCVLFYQDFDHEIGNIGESKLDLTAYLRRPSQRLDEYISLLKDFLRYTTQAKQDPSSIEEAITMLMDLKKKAMDQMQLRQIQAYDGTLADLGPLLRWV